MFIYRQLDSTNTIYTKIQIEFLLQLFQNQISTPEFVVLLECGHLCL